MEGDDYLHVTMTRRAATLCVFLATAALLWAAPEPGGDGDARRLEQWRKHPEQLARLRQNWQRFQELPPARREQVVKLDEELHRQPASAQARLWNALEHYVDWLERLPEAGRKKVTDAPTKEARLAVVRELRDRQWMERQPKAVREEWAKLQGEPRAAFVRERREEARQRKRAWTIAARFWKELEARQPLPSRPADFPGEVRTYVEEYLKPMLSEAEKKRLAKAEGTWPGYPLTLVELADHHPPALPGPEGPRTLAELPQAVQNRLNRPKGGGLPKPLKGKEGRWPDFARAVTELAAARKQGAFPHELWPWNYHCLTPPMKDFVDKTLRPALNASEQTDLLHSEGKWPEFPQTIEKLARAHDLQPPWHTLPGPREKWDAYRLGRPRAGGLPDVAAPELRDFALFELDPGERARLKLSPADPASRQRLLEAYHRKRRPGERPPAFLAAPPEKAGRPGL